MPHPQVSRDFASILDLIAGYAGHAIGRSKVSEIKKSISSLKDYPHIGSVRPDIMPGLRAIPCAEKAVICFTVNDDTHTVRIICVTYAGQDWQSIARSRE
jgi:plasmid stabilization system protein ParE